MLHIADAENEYRESVVDDGDNQTTWAGAVVAEPGFDADDGVHRCPDCYWEVRLSIRCKAQILRFGAHS